MRFPVRGFIVPVAAACLATAPAAEEPRLYTNADLARHATPGTSPASPSPEAAAAQANEDWQFVAAHLERQYRRIELEQQNTLDRQLAYTEPEPEGDYVWGGYYSPYGWDYYSPGYGYDNGLGCARSDRRHLRGKDGIPRFITPLHARGRIAPMATTRGIDAVPGHRSGPKHGGGSGPRHGGSRAQRGRR